MALVASLPSQSITSKTHHDNLRLERPPSSLEAPLTATSIEKEPNVVNGKRGPGRSNSRGSESITPKRIPVPPFLAPSNGSTSSPMTGRTGSSNSDRSDLGGRHRKTSSSSVATPSNPNNRMSINGFPAAPPLPHSRSQSYSHTSSLHPSPSNSPRIPLNQLASTNSPTSNTNYLQQYSQFNPQQQSFPTYAPPLQPYGQPIQHQSFPLPQYPFMPSPHPNAPYSGFSPYPLHHSHSSNDLHQQQQYQQHQAMLMQQAQYQQQQWQMEMMRSQNLNNSQFDHGACLPASLFFRNFCINLIVN
jgi:hypothetical protein